MFLISKYQNPNAKVCLEININIIDGGSWSLVIKFLDNSERKYVGRSDEPNNFEAFERLNFRLIEEVKNGYIEY